MHSYLTLLNKIIKYGVDSVDRTGIGTRSLFGEQLRFDLTNKFPAVTTKKLAWKSVVSELLWFIEGSTDERRLAEIHFGTRDSTKTTIWTANANAEYWKSKANYEGDIGRGYGFQWRHWERPAIFHKHGNPPTVDGATWISNRDGSFLEFLPPVDQLANLINGLKNNPNSRRHILSAWNPGELDRMALPPCHMMAQFYTRNNELSCQVYVRSNDIFLGCPFNIASYSLLTHMIAQVCGFTAKELIICIGDAHIYNNHMQAVIEQLTRQPKELPTLWLNPDITDINKFSMDDCKLVGYDSYPTIKADMAV